MDNDFTFAEYAVKPKGDRQVTGRRLFFILLNVALDVVGVFLCIRFNVTLIAAVALVAVPLWFYTMKIAETEYEYTIEAGDLTLCVLHGNWRHTLFSVPLTSVSAVFPDTEEYAEKILRFAPEAEFVALSSPDSPDRYAALFTDGDKRHLLFRFDATDRMLRVLRRALGNVVTVRKTATPDEETGI